MWLRLKTPIDPLATTATPPSQDPPLTTQPTESVGGTQQDSFEQTPSSRYRIQYTLGPNIENRVQKLPVIPALIQIQRSRWIRLP